MENRGVVFLRKNSGGIPNNAFIIANGEQDVYAKKCNPERVKSISFCNGKAFERFFFVVWLSFSDGHAK